MWKVQLVQGLGNLRQSTQFYFPPTAQAPSHVQKIILLLASPTAIQLCRICRAHTVADTEALIPPVPLHLQGTGLKPLQGRHQSRKRHQKQPYLSRSRAGSTRAGKPKRWGFPVSPYHSPMLKSHQVHTGGLGQHTTFSGAFLCSTCNTELHFLPDPS